MRLAAGFLLLLAALPAAAGDFDFDVLDFGARGRINQWYFADFDGDGREEVFLLIGRRIHVFRASAAGRFDLEKPHVFEPAEDALYYDIAQVDSDPKTRELVLVTPAGVVYHTFANGSFSGKSRPLVTAGNLVRSGQDDNLHFRDFLRDLDENGLEDVVLGTGRGFEIYYQRRKDEGEDGAEGLPGVWYSRPDRIIAYDTRGTLTIDPAGLTGQIRGSIEIPDFRLVDFTGDGCPDFVLDEGQSLRVFPCGKDRLFETKAVHELDLSPLAEPDGSLPRFVARDVNGDGKPDFLVTRGREGITDLYLFGKPLTDPTLHLKVKGWSFPPRLTDLNRDGRLDLVVPTTPEMDIGTALSVLVSKAITVKNHIFLNTGDAESPFPREPDRTREIRVKLRLYVDVTGSIKAAHSVLVEYDGDFDGDGRPDLVYRGDTDELLFFPGGGEEIFADSPVRTLSIPDTADAVRLETTVKELNGDGRPDLAILYVSRGRKADRVVVLLSRKD